MHQKEKIIDCYTKTSETYSNQMLNELDDKPFDQWILKSFAESNKTRGTMLDLGCGPGQTTGYMRQQGIKDLVGIDLTPAMVKKASENFPRIEFEIGNILDLQKTSNTIGSIIAFYSIVHLTSDLLEPAFREIHRVLKPQSEFLFACHEGNETIHRTDFLDEEVDISFYYFTMNDLFDALDKVGFSVVQAYKRYPYEGKEYPSKRAYMWVRKD